MVLLGFPPQLFLGLMFRVLLNVLVEFGLVVSNAFFIELFLFKEVLGLGLNL